MNGFTDELLAAFKACGAQRVLVAFDRDDAGDRAAEVLAKKLTSEGLDCFRLLFPKGMDANAYACAVKPPEKSLGVVIRSAEWLGAGAKPALTTRCFNSVHQWVDGDEALRSASRSAEQPTSSSVTESAATSNDAAADAEPIVLAAETVAADPPPIAIEAPEPEAAAVPSSPAPQAETKRYGEQLVVSFGERRYRVRGLPKQLGEALKVNVLVTRGASHETLAPADAGDAGLHVDTLDLYQARQRQAFAKLASSELGSEERVIQHDLGRLLLTLEQTIDERARAAERSEVAPPAAMTPEETAAALAFLRDEKLLERLLLVVRRRGDRQHGADRLDPESVFVFVDVADHHLRRRSSSAWAKYADAVRRMSFARRSSRFSRSSCLSRSRSLVVTPSPHPAT